MEVSLGIWGTGIGARGTCLRVQLGGAGARMAPRHARPRRASPVGVSGPVPPAELRWRWMKEEPGPVSGHGEEGS
jgi:hypothetical protein